MYSIQNVDSHHFKSNFKIIFNIGFDYKYTMTKELFVLFLNILNKT